MPKKAVDQAKDHTDILRVAGILSMGYGLYPKMVAKDKRLSIESRGIYSYFCSYAGSGNTAFPRVEMICEDCNISRDRYYKHFRPLVSLGYVSVTQEKIAGGKFSRNIYTLNMEIAISPAAQPAETAADEPCTCFKATVEKPCTCFPTPVNKDTNSNSSRINNTKQDIFPSFFELTEREKERMGVERIIEQAEIDYLNLDAEFPGMADAVKEVIGEMYCAPEVAVRGQRVPQAIVRGVLAKMTQDGIRHAVRALFEAGKSTDIRNPKKYLMAAIYDGQTSGALRDAIDYSRHGQI